MILQKILETAQSYHATLVAVSKTKPIEDVMKVYDQGQRDFGENRVQELVSKYEIMPKDIHWHMIGTLQKNKVKAIVPFIYLIHSADNLDLILTIQKEAAKIERHISILIQFHIAEEETKQGFLVTEIDTLMTELGQQDLSHVQIVGVMGMATFTDDQHKVRAEFAKLANAYKYMKSNYFENQDGFAHVSMGMSGDYLIALQEGSTMIRVGSAIFGGR
jgi:PLP dependent protein